MIKNLEKYPEVRKIDWDKQSLDRFEKEIAQEYEEAKIHGPVHLSGGNEESLIEIFKRIRPTDWVFSTWRSHYHALLKGISAEWLRAEIRAGHSITLVNKEEKFYASAIVGGILPIALGVAIGLKRDGSKDKVWCFVGDMTFETGQFYEVHKYAKNFDLPLHFVVEDNGISTYTPTEATWNKKREIPEDVLWYYYDKIWPHYGTGKWVAF